LRCPERWVRLGTIPDIGEFLRKIANKSPAKEGGVSVGRHGVEGTS